MVWVAFMVVELVGEGFSGDAFVFEGDIRSEAFFI